MPVLQTQLGDLIVEQVQSSSTTLAARVSTHPVEQGADIADHIRQDPKRVTISGVFSATPLGTTDDLEAEGPERLQGARDRLTALLGQVLTYVAEDDLMDACAIVALTLAQGPDTGDAVPFEATLQEVRQVSTQSVTIPPEATPPDKKAAASSDVDRGDQTGTDASETDTARASSILSDLLGL